MSKNYNVNTNNLLSNMNGRFVSIDVLNLHCRV